MNAVRQKTIAREGDISGVGLHTGKIGTLTLKPAPVGAGIRFFRQGRPVTETPEKTSQESLRCSTLGSGPDRLMTVEHLLASIGGLGITNLIVEAEGPEVPGLDGSALPFVQRLKALGIVEQEKTSEVYRISEPIFCYDKAKAIAIYPAGSFSVSYVLDYEHPYLRGQIVDFKLTPENFEKEIAPARTFCTDAEALELQKHGFGLGATPENTLVVSQDGSHVKGLRFPDECARHKVLDILGDMHLLGFPVLGHVVAIRSGHALNRQLVRRIKEQRDAMQKPLMDREEIKKILPHREPFLLVDGILEMGEKNIVGFKNVSADEAYFKGHFPGKPVMPGVLMVEALAQAGGVLLLSKPEHRGKLAFLAAVNEARFRRIVVPGERLRLEVEVVKWKSRIGVVKGVAKVGDETACEAEIMFSLAD